MSVEVRPLGVSCNIQCHYCYQNPERDAGNVAHRYDLEKIKAAVVREGGPFMLFGGEPLMTRERDLEERFRRGCERFGGSGIQTNGSLIRDNYVRLFKQYKVHIGLSIDGPGELNDARWAGSEAKTRETTAKTEHAIERLCREGLKPSLIVTLHRLNATADTLPILQRWIRHLGDLGVSWIRLHLLEVEDESIRRKYGLTTRENIDALLGFARLERDMPNVRFDVFTDLRSMLMGNDRSTTCVWNACDPYTTRAVQGIEGDGQRTTCGRTNKDGVDFVKADLQGFERYMALYHTPQEYGGCRDCRFFLMCKGQCPGTAIDNDWRNRTEHCEVWKGVCKTIETELVAEGWRPLSLHPIRLQVEKAFLRAWQRGMNPSLADLLLRLDGCPGD